MTRVERALVWLGTLPTRPAARPIGMALAGLCFFSTLYLGVRPLGVALAAYGVVALLHGYGMWSDRGGIRSANARDEDERVAYAEARPFGRTRVGRTVLAATRSDTQVAEGVAGMNGMILGPIAAVVGTLVALGVLGP